MAAIPGFDVKCGPGGCRGQGRSDRAASTRDTACVVVQYPSFLSLRDLTKLPKPFMPGALLIVAVTEIVSSVSLTPPGEMGADVVTAEGQSIGNPWLRRPHNRRPLRRAREVPPSDARPPGWADRRR